MKKLLILFLLLITNYSILNAQSGWFQITTPMNNLHLNKIQFTSENTGYSVGMVDWHDSSYLLKTTNSGMNWQAIPMNHEEINSLFLLMIIQDI